MEPALRLNSPDCQSGSLLTRGSLNGGRGMCLARVMYVLACVSRWVGFQERVTTKFGFTEYGGGRHVLVKGAGEEGNLSAVIERSPRVGDETGPTSSCVRR